MMKLTSRKLLGILLALALLFALVPGLNGKAHADNTEILLTTITATAKEQASYSTANVATVSFSYSSGGSSAYRAAWGWWGYGWTATVTPADGYTITKCVFYDDAGRTATDSQAPFVVETTEEDKTPQVNGTPILAYTSKGIKKIEVYGYATPAAVSVTGVSLNKSSTTLTVGATETLTATVSPDDATNKSVTWASDNTAVATVDTNGLVTAVAPGTANITATANDGSGVMGTCAVTVNNPIVSVTGVSLNKSSTTLTVGATETLTATVLPDNAADKTVAWASKNPDIARVSEGVVTAVAPGTVEIFATATNGTDDTADDRTATCIVTVHSHSFTYSASGATITANCTSGCPNGYDTNGIALTLSASDATYTGSSYTGASLDSAAWTAAGLTAPTIEYAGRNSTSYTKSTTAPTDAGDYTASVTVGGATASVDYTIAQASGSISYSETSMSKTYGDAAFTNALTKTGDGAVSYASDNTAVATVNSATGEVMIVSAGSATITATVQDSANYTYATKTASYTLNISPATITVNAEGFSGAYDGNPHGINVAVTTPASGATVMYGTVEGSYDLTASPSYTDAGTYTVYYQVSDPGYATVSNSAVVTITKATVTVTADAKSKTYGEADPALTYTSSGLVGSDTLTGTLERASGENAGTYAITQGSSLTAGGNYTISFTGANFTINKAAITITADDKSSKYGEDIAELTHTVGGAYKAGDELNVTLNTAASPTANVGEYEITVAYNNANYDATLVKGKYTITKTGLTVTAAGYTGSYDGNPHGITVDVGSSGATVYYAATELTAENYAAAGSTTNPTYTDAGEYTVYFYVVSGNYDPDTVSGSKTVSISKATGTATDAQKPTAKTDLVADNSDQALVTAPAALPEGYTAVQYSLDGETWTDTVPTGKDAGSYTVNYKYVGDKNHNDFQGEPFTVTIKTLTVSFEVNGGSAVAAQSVVKGEKLARPADPTREGYAFDGWFEDATCTVPYDFNKTVTDNVTLYAKWTPNVYQMTAVYGATTDANHIWYKQSGTDTVTNNNTGVEITVKLTNGPDDSFDHFTGVQLDGVTLTRDVDYAARAGSTVVTLFPATLRRLSNGAHTVTVLFDNNSVSTRLTVRQNSSTPATGDESHAALYLAALTVSVLGMAAVTAASKKRRTAKH